jgi:hypothetical protein
MALSKEILLEVQSLQPGAEIDRRIAHRVMGVGDDSPVPAYSTDIAAAWSVVEQMVRTEGVYFGAPHYKNRRQALPGYPEGTECWYCVINSKLLNKVVICAESAALAICRATLLWERSKGETSG